VTQPGDKTIGAAVIDLGGGPLGSRGRNRLVTNTGLAVAVTNANASTAPIRVDAAGNYWGGGRPDVTVSGNVMFTVPKYVTTDPASRQ
jgi:hypothetical protein